MITNKGKIKNGTVIKKQSEDDIVLLETDSDFKLLQCKAIEGKGDELLKDLMGKSFEIIIQ